MGNIKIDGDRIVYILLCFITFGLAIFLRVIVTEGVKRALKK